MAVVVKRRCYDMAVNFTEFRSRQWLSNVVVTTWRLILLNPGHDSGCETSLLRHGGYFYRIKVTAVAVKRRCYGMAVIFTESRLRQWLSNVAVTAWQLFLPNQGYGSGCQTSLLRHGGYFYRIKITAVAVKRRCYGMAVIFTESRLRQ